jgi:hypothetical protein
VNDKLVVDVLYVNDEMVVDELVYVKVIFQWFYFFVIC